MDKLRGMDAVGIVFRRVSDGYEVIKCILEFYKEMADVERSYALRISKLCQSTNYTFHSNILSQWLGSEPFEEIGTLKHCWQNLGNELLKLASLHDEKAESFHEGVRQPLVDILPELHEERRELQQRKMDMENEIRNANKKFEKVRKNYFKLGDTLAQLRSPPTGGVKFPWSQHHMEKKLEDVEKEFKGQEQIYMESYREVVETHQSLNERVDTLLEEVHQKELKRVNTVAKSLQEFARTLSNTAPAYLESMKRIVIGVDEINGEDDITSFVAAHTHLQQLNELPHLEYHQITLSSRDVNQMMTDRDQDKSKNDSVKLDSSIRPKPPLLPKPKERDMFTASTSQVDSIATPKNVSPVKTRTSSNNDSEPMPSQIRKTRTNTVPVEPTINPQLKPRPPKPVPVVKIVGTPQTTGERKNNVAAQTRARPATKPSKPVTTCSNKDELLERLRGMAQANDYYSLLGVTTDASKDELSRARRELTAKLHPDHFTGNPEQQTKASERLVVVNQAFHDVLNKEEPKKLYDQMCKFRAKYHLIEKQEKRGLESAKVRLLSLHSNMKKARCPLPLLTELQLSLQYIDILLESSS